MFKNIQTKEITFPAAPVISNEAKDFIQQVIKLKKILVNN